MLLIADAKPLIATLVTRGLSFGISPGALVIVLSWAPTWVYVRWANRHYDRELERFGSGGGRRVSSSDWPRTRPAVNQRRGPSSDAH